jgi:hypothetical protein
MNLRVSPELLEPMEAAFPQSDGMLWVKKGRNVFRGVIEIYLHDEGAAVAAGLVRDIVKREFKPGLIVPFAFGAILHFDGTSPNASEMANYIDTKARWRDTWQWVIVCDESRKAAYGIHTWVHGYLRPVYDDILRQLATRGYACTSQDKAVDKFFTRIWSLNAKLLKAKQVLLILAAVLSLGVIAGKLLGVWK